MVKNIFHKYIFFLFVLFVVIPFVGFAQNDTLIINNDYKFKVGVKGLFEKSGAPTLEPINKNVLNYGVTLVYKFGNSKSFLETGAYSFTRKYNSYNEVTHYNIQIPLKYRLETKIIYFSIGFYGSYLLSKNVYYSAIYTEISSDRKLNIGYTAALGIEKNISNQLSIFVEAEFSNDLTTMKTENSFFYFNDSYASYYSNGGFAIGFYFKIPNK